MSSYQNTEADQVVQLASRLTSLEREVQELKEDLKGSFEDPETPPNLPADTAISSIVRLTQELFAESKVEIETEADPEEPEIEFMVVKVSCHGDLKEILAKEMEWIRRVNASEFGGSGRVRLLVSPSN